MRMRTLVATTWLCLTVSTTGWSFPTTCLKATVTAANMPPKDEYYCYTDGSAFLTPAPTSGTRVIEGFGGATSTQNQLKGPTPPTPAKEAHIKCGADTYGKKYPHVNGYTETFVPAFGYLGRDGATYAIAKQEPTYIDDPKIEGDTSGSDTLLYYYGWHAGYAYDKTPLNSNEYAIYVLVHERGHQNGSNDDSVGGVNDQAGLAAALAYRADNHGQKCPNGGIQ